MSLLMISETMCEKEEILRTLSKDEKEFIMQFAFKTSDKELTEKLIEEMADARDGDEMDAIRKKYSAMYEVKPAWLNQIENLLISIEMYRAQEEKAINTLVEVLGAYGIDVSEEELRQTNVEEIKDKVAESQKEEEETQVEDDKRTSEPEHKSILHTPVL